MTLFATPTAAMSWVGGCCLYAGCLKKGQQRLAFPQVGKHGWAKQTRGKSVTTASLRAVEVMVVVSLETGPSRRLRGRKIQCPGFQTGRTTSWAGGAAARAARPAPAPAV